MSPFGFRSFNRRVTNDMISCTKRGKMAARILASTYPIFKSIKKVLNAYLPYFEEHKKLR